MTKIQIYIKDIKLFTEKYNSVRTLWYQKYGINLPRGEAVLEALTLLESNLKNTGSSNDNKGQNIYKYERTGL